MDAIRLGAPIRSYDGETTLATCRLSLPGRSPEDLWIRTTGEAAVTTADAFVALALLRAMTTGSRLVSEGPVSRSLLDSGIPAIQALYSVWHHDEYDPRHQRFRTVQVDAPAAEDQAPTGGVGLFFSNGVDSSFSLVEAREEITDLIFIRHWVKGRSDAQVDEEQAGVQKVAQAFGMRVILAETNAKSLLRYPPHWVYFHGAMLAAVALELQGRLRNVHIAGSGDVRRLAPWGTHPYLDPLWSTGAMQIVHDRINVTRLGKVAVVAENRLLMENLRVCEEPQHKGLTCEKCAYTMLALQALGRYEQGLPFAGPPLTPWQIIRVNWSRDTYDDSVEEIVEYLQDTGTHPELARAARIARLGVFYHGPGRLVRGDWGRRLKARAERERRRWAP